MPSIPDPVIKERLVVGEWFCILRVMCLVSKCMSRLLIKGLPPGTLHAVKTTRGAVFVGLAVFNGSEIAVLGSLRVMARLILGVNLRGTDLMIRSP